MPRLTPKVDVAFLQSKMLQAERRLADVTRLVSDWVWEANQKFELTFLSERVKESLGFHPVELLDKSLLDIGSFITRDGAAHDLNWRSPFRDVPFRAQDKKGCWRYFLVSGLPVFCQETGGFQGMRGTAIDITVRREAEKHISRLSRVVEQSPVLVMITDTAGAIEYVNPKFTEITGFSTSDLKGHAWPVLNTEKDADDKNKEIREAILKGREWCGEFLQYKKNGGSFWVAMSSAAIKDDAGAIIHFVFSMEDISERKYFEGRFLQQSNYDQLTNLPNRALFNDRLSQGLVRARRSNQQMALVLVNLDRFKSVNDTISHATGDQLLRETASRISACVGGPDSVARIGGDEFSVLIENAKDRNQVINMVTSVMESLTKPFHLFGWEVNVTASIGISMFPEDCRDRHSMLMKADSALRGAKEQGGNSFRFFTPGMNNKASEFLRMTGELRRALERNEFEVFYQPVASAKTGCLKSAEALLRWRHPKQGLVSPVTFIPLAEETGLIEPIGDWVINTVCRQIKAWRDNGAPPLRIAVNISPSQLRKGDHLIEVIRSAIKETQISPQCLALELTESAFLSDVEKTKAVLTEINKFGVTIAIDDFGTGYSSLAYLKKLPVNVLKIDRSFITDVTTNEDSSAIAGAIIAMAHGMKMTIVAEGVETEEQMEYLRGKSCEMLQGYLFSAPISSDEFAKYLEKDGKSADSSKVLPFVAPNVA